MAWAIFTTLMVIAALRTTLVLAVLFAILDVAFYLLSFGALASIPDLTKRAEFWASPPPPWRGTCA